MQSFPFSYEHAKTITYSNAGKSDFYVNGDVALIIDSCICNKTQNELLDYSLITNVQNTFMHDYKKVFRFLHSDKITNAYINSYLNSFDNENITQKQKIVQNRNDYADASPLEFFFEESFARTYGIDSVQFLNKEFPIVDKNGNNFFLDYLVHTENGDIAVEENGISYHHPQIIGSARYERQLEKQNLCAKYGIKLYRFSTEDCKFSERLEDDIKRFFGKDTKTFRKNGILLDRTVELKSYDAQEQNGKLYDHQKEILLDIQNARKQGTQAFLVVLPTAAGKSRIVEEDIKSFSKDKNNFSALILSPNTSITDDWKMRIEKSLPTLKDKIEIRTYAFFALNYMNFSSDKYDYIVADEAHHAVAETYKRVIQHFSPKFLIGLTATDERPDKKRLETIFGLYKTPLSLTEAMQKGIVAEASVYRIETNINLSKVRFNGKDYVNSDLEKTIRVTSRNGLIADVLKKIFFGCPI